MVKISTWAPVLAGMKQQQMPGASGCIHVSPLCRKVGWPWVNMSLVVQPQPQNVHSRLRCEPDICWGQHCCYRKCQAILSQGCFVRRDAVRGVAAWGTLNGIHPAWSRQHSQRTWWPNYNPIGGKSWNPSLCWKAPIPLSYRYKREACQQV